MNCPRKKESEKELSVAAAGEALVSQFKVDFTLIACMANTIMGGVWYLDSGASFHMRRGTYISLVILRRKTSSITYSLEMMGGIVLRGLVQFPFRGSHVLPSLCEMLCMFLVGRRTWYIFPCWRIEAMM